MHRLPHREMSVAEQALMGVNLVCLLTVLLDPNQAAMSELQVLIHRSVRIPSPGLRL